MKQHGKGWTVLSLFAVLTLTILSCSPSFAQGTGPSDFQATPLTPESTIQIAKSAPGTSASKLTSVIVKLQGASLAAYAGGIQGLAPTSPSVTGEAQLNVESAASKAYLAHLAQVVAAQTLAFARPAGQCDEVDEFDGGGGEFLGLEERSEIVKTRVGDLHHGHVGFLGALVPDMRPAGSAQ